MIFDTSLNIELICRIFKIDISDIEYITLMRLDSKRREEYMRIGLSPYYYHNSVPFMTCDNYWIVLRNKDIIGKAHVESKQMELNCNKVQLQEIGWI